MMAGTAWGGQKGTGGTVTTTTIGGKLYYLHTFTNVGSDSFTPSENLAPEYLVVGGGGGGGKGNWGCAGGGAGGLITSVRGCYSGGGTPGVGSNPNVPAVLAGGTAYTVTVGDGGNGGSQGSNGWDSVFGNTGTEFARAKGGGGGGGPGSVGLPGGSGGGGGTYITPPGAGAGTLNQGNAGGAGSAGDDGGGGGGAGNPGASSATANGGSGLANTITGSSVRYAGGGGGGRGGDPQGGASDGGGPCGSPGTANSGGGGGGSYHNGAAQKGGSGVVIIRYKDVNTLPTQVGKNITVGMVSNSVTVTGQQLDNGSTDADGDPLVFGINGQVSVTYTNGDFGDHVVTFAVYDGTAMSSCQQTVTVVCAGSGLLASGGDVVSIYTNYPGTETQVVYGCHQFTSSGYQFIPKKALAVEYLVIGGGGGGGSGNANGTGGGGAGGYRCSVVGEKSGGNNNAEPVTNLTAFVGVPVTVGSGSGSDTKGNASSFGAISADGGGAGGGSGAGGSGGSGGGGGYLAGGGNGTSLQGCNGGPAFDGGGQWGGGGGGGAKTAGIGRVDSSTHGNGGDGLASSITGGTPVTRAGGGGSGWGNTSGTAGAGASAEGGGGNGGYSTGGNGRSGIVIVRYEIPVPSVKVTAPTNNQVLAWNASIAATATVANATVTSVDFYTNTASAAYGLAGSDSDPTGGYTLSLAAGSLPAGTNHIYAVMNASEGTFTSAVNAVIVETLPIVTVTFPTDGQSFANLSSITATATVSHGIAPYTVYFYTNNETQVGSDGSAPYTSSLLGPLGGGSYQIYAKVTDGNGDTVYSTTNTITVLPPALAVSVAGPTEYPYNGTIASTATVVFATSPYTVKFWTNSVPATGWGQAGADGISTSLYAVSFGPLAPGQYSIRATVDDAYPASATSSTYTVTVLAAPTVTLNTPTPSQQFALNASVTSTVTCGSGKTPYTVTFYTNENGSAYGPAGTVAGTASQTSFTNVLSSLGAGTYGIYAVVTDAYYSVATSVTNTFLVGGTLPTLSHRPPTAVTTGSATFNGFLSTTGNPSTYVYVLYGQNTNAWSFTNAVTAPGGGWTNNSPIAASIGSLTPGLTYYYTIGASNGAPFSATTTASGSTNFITGEVTAQNTGGNAQYKTGGSSNGQFTIYRPATCTNEALVVSYTLSGATVSPSGSATLNAGSTSAVVTLAPSILVGYSSNAVLTLTAGAGDYPYGTPANSATCTVLATDVTPTPPYKAFGGDVLSIITNNVGTSSQTVYAVHQYTNTASTAYFIPSTRIRNVEFLVVGGGGGGAVGNSSTYSAGGGGAGGLITSVSTCKSGGGTPGVGSNPNLPATLTGGVAYNVTVGDGGAGSVGEGSGTNGQDSVFGNTGSEFARAKGGGGGGRYDTGGLTGGSGGGTGGYGSPLAGGAGTVNQGFAGGGRALNKDSGGGGGGAGNAGGDSCGSGAGSGGPGLTNTITGSSVAYAGGGGGADGNNNHGGGGIGGGAAGGSGASGSPNTGGGGGAKTYNGSGGKGGSGIVIVRYDLTPPKGTVFMLR